ncbi:MAG: glycosyltransferase family 39 protein [Acidihalobacter sp.]|uniref:glycosyltransferase family 39 protein n=1 Tax=Acidihalobacter sp. TaxID=1872108 RepID=UPI00307E9B8D
MFSVIVPTYNERDNASELIRRVLEAFSRLDEPAELLLVDDDSPDGTAGAMREAAAEHGARESQVRVIVRDSDKGLAKAVAAGFEQAHGDVLAVIDADLSHPPELLPDLLAAIRGGADVAIGSRYVGGGGTEGWPLIRRIVSRGACLLARPLSPVKDITSGFFALRRECLDELHYIPRGYKIGLELFARLPGKRMVEVPFTFRDRTRGASKLGSAVMLAYLVQLGSLYRARFPRLIGYLQFGLVGVLGMAVDSATFGLAYWYLGLQQLGPTLGGFFAQTVSFLVAARFNFALNARWTFRERRSHARMSAFLAVSVVGFILRSLIFESVVSLPAPQTPGLWANLVHTLSIEQIALVIGVIAASLWNFWGSRRWAFPAGGEMAGEGLPRPEELISRSWVVILLSSAAILRVLFAAQTPLTFDESYYWQWSRHLAWGYFDHPPMIAYLIAAGTRLLGTTQLGVRLVPSMMSIALVWMVYRLAAVYWRNSRAALWALVLAVSTPLFAVGGMITTPDIPLLFFWGATVLLTLRALERMRPFDWLLMGLCAGLGMLSKFPMALLYVALLFALLSTSRGRRSLATPYPWLALLTTAIVTTPMWIWEYTHNWGSFGFHFRQGLGSSVGATPATGAASSSGGLHTLLAYVAGQAGIITPLLLLVVIAGLVQAFRRAPADRPDAAATLQPREIRPFLLWPALVTFGVFGGASLLASSGPNWSAPAYATAFPLAGGLLAALIHHRRRWLRWLSTFAVAFAAVLSLYVHIEVAHPLIAYRNYPRIFPFDHKPLAHWADTLRAAQARGGRQAWVVGSNYKIASVLGFYMQGHPQTSDPFEVRSGSAYLAWQQTPPVGTPGLFIANSRHPANIARLFNGPYRYLGDFSVARRGVVRNTYYAFSGTLNSKTFTETAQ